MAMDCKMGTRAIQLHHQRVSRARACVCAFVTTAALSDRRREEGEGDRGLSHPCSAATASHRHAHTLRAYRVNY